MQAMRARLDALRKGITEEAEDAITSEIIALESQLTIADLMLLFRAAMDDGTSPWEAITFSLFRGHESEEPAPMFDVVGLEEHQLLQLAGQARLLRMGFVQWRRLPDRLELILTPKGALAVDWWMATVVEDALGLPLPEGMRSP